MRGWTLLGGAIVCEVAASLSLRAALDHPGWYALVAAGYVSAFALLGAVLRTGLALGVAYGVWGAAGVVATAVMSSALFGEGLTAVALLGIGVVVAGVLLVEVGAHRADRARRAAPRARA